MTIRKKSPKKLAVVDFAFQIPLMTTTLLFLLASAVAQFKTFISNAWNIDSLKKTLLKSPKVAPLFSSKIWNVNSAKLATQVTFFHFLFISPLAKYNNRGETIDLIQLLKPPSNYLVLELKKHESEALLGYMIVNAIDMPEYKIVFSSSFSIISLIAGERSWLRYQDFRHFSFQVACLTFSNQ